MFSHSTKKIFTILFCIITFTSFGQNTKKETLSRYKKLTSLSLESLKTKNYGELARELSTEDFISYYIENGKEKISKKYGNEYIDSLYKDVTYTFYVRRTQTHLIDFIKIKTEEIEDIDISEIDGNSIRQKFIDEIVPVSDKERVGKKSKNCGMGSDYWDFKYVYNRTSRLVEVKYKWKITCEFIKVINKKYSAFYNIDTRAFEN